MFVNYYFLYFCKVCLVYARIRICLHSCFIFFKGFLY